MATKEAMIQSFIEDAPPGELRDVVNDVKALTTDEPNLLKSQSSAYQNYNEQQFTTVKLPNGSKEVIVCPFNGLENGRYFDTESQTSFAFDQVAQRASDSQSHSLDSQHSDLMLQVYFHKLTTCHSSHSLLKAFSKHASEHFASFATGVYPYSSENKIALVIVANKYSPNNFWNGRWRSQYILDPSDSSISGHIKVDVHYYEDGNVRLLTTKPVTLTPSSSSALDVVRAISNAEKRYQEELNRAFTQLSEGVFRSLRRQLPVTRQKIDWEKIGGYRLGQDIGGGRSR